MILVAIIKFFIGVFGSVITILSGILFIRHRQIIEYFKSSFTFVREDFSSKIEAEHWNFINGSVEAFKYGISSILESKSSNVFGEGKTNEIHQLLVLIGKLLVVIGILGIITISIGTIWMLSTRQINVNFY